MDKLLAKQQTEIKKMSDVRLCSKLTKAGFSPEQLEGMDRTAMMDSWAVVVAKGEDVATATVAVTPVSYDVDLERRKFDFEVRRYEESIKRGDEEKEERKEERRLRAALESKREDEEREERRRRDDIEQKRWDEDAALKRAQLKMQEDRDRREREKNESVVSKLRIFGDAIKNSIVKMGNDPLDLVPFFANVDRIFGDLKVPNDLRVTLLKPYVNDKARILLNRLDATSVADYEYVKRYILEQFRCVPQFFLEQFNSIVRQSQETLKSFNSRLSLLLDSYLSSRQVIDFATLRNLLICDRVKSVLSEGSLGHLLRVEATLPKSWALPDQLADILDVYFANYDKNEKPRASAIGVTVPFHKQGQVNNYRNLTPFKAGNVNKVEEKPTKVAESTDIQPIVTRTPGIAGKSCFKCGSSSHLVAACPQRVVIGNRQWNASRRPNAAGRQVARPGRHVSTGVQLLRRTTVSRR